MSQKIEYSNTNVILTMIVCTVLLGLFVMVMTPQIPEQQDIDVPTAAEIAGAIVIPAMSGNLSLDNDKVNKIYDEIFKNSDWENEAEVLAIEELEDDDYEALADFLGIDEDDISNVVIKDIEVVANGDDTDDENANVYFKLKVYYEAEFGIDINAKETVYSQVEIEDGDVEEIDFSYDNIDDIF